MGQRTQVAINVKFVGGDGKEYIEREVYHYQWGGYHTGMFENLVGLFINAKNYLIKLNFVNFTESYLQEFEARINGNKYTNKKNLLRTDFVDMINSEKNTKTSDELKYYEEFHGKTINEVSEKEFWDFALNYQDCNDGRILIDILLEKGKSYCKWNFAKYKSFENDKDKFKKIAENELTKNVKEIYKYWFEDDYYLSLKNYTKEIMKFIKKIGTLEIDGANKNLIEYDKEHFKNKFLEYDK
jgi:hypothetical protein